MTIDEAIKHAEEVASRLFDDRVHCIKCAEEHQQLAEWLKELKQLREQESKVGHWIVHRGYNTDGFGIEYSSSKCNDWNDEKSRYCPNCGAKMEEEE